MNTATLTLPPAKALKLKVHWTERLAHTGMVIVALGLLAFLAAPLLAILLKSIENNDGHPAPFGAIGGGLLGAVAGSAVGEGHGSLLAGVIGGIAGAVAGDQIQDHLERQKGLEITVRLDNGDLRAITQAADGQMFYAGQRVRLLSSGGITRVTA